MIYLHAHIRNVYLTDIYNVHFVYFFKSLLNEILQVHKCNYVPRIKKKCMLKQTQELLHYQSTLMYYCIKDKIVSTCANFINLNHKISLYFSTSRIKYRFFSVCIYSICGRFFISA